MKLWHDDVRPAPEGWTWARTNAQARDLLVEHFADIEACSLDHDLGFEDVDPTQDGALLLAGHSPEGTGLDLVRWMVENDLVPPAITIHSWNHNGAKEMAATLADAGHHATVEPYNLSMAALRRAS